MVWALRLAKVLPVVVVALSLACNPTASDPAHFVASELDQAVVDVDGVCAGAVVGDTSHALTAAHCLRDGRRLVHLKLADGEPIGATVTFIDFDIDMVVLKLDRPADVRPLQLATELPKPGDGVWFFPHRVRADVAQLAMVERLGHCPSLPNAPAVLFTSIRGLPGDSGAPLVDLDMRVVGLVHGGARCSIAAPTAAIAPLVAPKVAAAQ